MAGRGDTPQYHYGTQVQENTRTLVGFDPYFIEQLSHIVRKSAFSYEKNKGTDQLCYSRARAEQHLCFSLSR